MGVEKLKKLERPELEAKLEECLKKPLAIVVAPSGYGKTTVAREYFAKHPRMKDIWITLGQSEENAGWIWQEMCARIEQSGIEAGKQLKEMGLPETKSDMERLIQAIRNHLDYSLCIVFDDYQKWNTEAVNHLITELAYADIPFLHLLIISRYSPDIPYEKMLLRGYCGLLDQKDLTLSEEETREILRSNHVEPGPKEMKQLIEYTDGWIAAVYLALFDYRQQGYFRLTTNMINLLKKAVFDKLPLNIRELLTGMSLFSGFYLDEAIYVTGIGMEESFLRQTIDVYGFGRFDVNSKKYTIHSLLRCVALEQAEQCGLNHGEIYDRDGQWQERQGNLIPAVTCYRKAGRTDRILNLLSENASPAIYDGAPAVFEEIFRELPVEDKLHSPGAYLRYIYSVAVQHRVDIGKKLFTEAQEGCRRLEEAGEDTDRLKGELLLIEALFRFNSLHSMTECMQEANRLLNGYSSVFADYYVLTYGAPNTLYLYHNCKGGLRRTVEDEKEYTRYYMKLIQNVNGGWDELYDAEYAMITGDVTKGLELSRRVCEKAKFRNQICVIISSYYTQLRCLICLGMVQETEKVLQELVQLEGTDRQVFRIDHELAVSIIAIHLDRADLISDWVKNFNLEECNRFVRNIRSGCIAHGLLLIREKQWLRLEAIAEQMMMPYEESIHLLATVFAYIYKAIAVLHLEDREKALFWLKKALELCSADNIRMPLIENSGELLQLIQEEARHSAFCAALLEQCESYQNNLKKFVKCEQKSVLSEREALIMQLVEEGRRNGEISERLHIALVTVEKTLTNIYRKLEVSNRAAAVAKWREIKEG